MKTPREILLARHQATETRLDKIRRDVVADLLPSPATKPGISFFLKFWRELILPRPQAWAAIVAMWVLIFALKLSTHETPHVVARKTAAAPEALAEVRQQKRLFAELAGLADPRVALPAKVAPPRPRSDRRPRNLIG